MHEFPRFPAPLAADELALVRDNPFALLVSSGPPPVATHTPMLLTDPGLGGGLVGTTLLGHLARANPQWRALGDEVLTVFSGPHGYVSPTAYATTPAVPTWNYAAVHLTGPIVLITDAEETLAIVERTVAVAEAGRDPMWDMTASRDRFRRSCPVSSRSGSWCARRTGRSRSARTSPRTSANGSGRTWSSTAPTSSPG